MADSTKIPTERQIREWRGRWKDRDTLISNILNLLDLPDREGFISYNAYIEKGEDRIEQVHTILCKYPDFEDLTNNETSGNKRISLDIRGFPCRNMRLNGNIFWRAHLEGADFHDAELRNIDFREAHLEGSDFWHARIINSKFKYANIRKADFTYADFSNTSLAYVKWYTPVTLLYWKSKHYPSINGTYIDRADFVGSRRLERHIKDEQWLLELMNSRRGIFLRLIHWIWWLVSDYGRSIFRLAITTAVLIIGFALLYGIGRIPLPDWLPVMLVLKEPWLNFHADLFQGVNPVLESFFLSFDIFSNLGVNHIRPQNFWAYIVVLCETMTGYIVLAGLISVLMEKFARRS